MLQPTHHPPQTHQHKHRGKKTASHKK